MANEFLAGSKGALIFAGAVILFAVAVAGTLADRFTPDNAAQSGEEQRGEDASETARSEPAREPDEPDDYDPYGDDDSVFGDYEASSENADLIDDTAGFDPSAGDLAGSASEADEPDEYDSDTAAESRPRSTRLSGKASAIPANARPENISVEAMKRYLRQPPRVGKSEG